MSFAAFIFAFDIDSRFCESTRLLTCIDAALVAAFHWSNAPLANIKIYQRGFNELS